MQLIQQVDAEEAVEKMENTLKRDPALAFKLIKLINSAAFGMTVEISSLRHAINQPSRPRLDLHGFQHIQADVFMAVIALRIAFQRPIWRRSLTD